MDWWNIVKLARTNDSTPEKQHGKDAYLVNDDVYREAGGSVIDFSRRKKDGTFESSEGDRFMEIEDIEEAIGRKLTFDDFKAHHLNWKSNTNKTLLDRLGGFEGQQRLAETQINEMLDSLHRGQPLDSEKMYFKIFRVFMEIFGDTSSLADEVLYAMRTYMGIYGTRR